MIIFFSLIGSENDADMAPAARSDVSSHFHVQRSVFQPNDPRHVRRRLPGGRLVASVFHCHHRHNIKQHEATLSWYLFVPRVGRLDGQIHVVQGWPVDE